MPRLRDSLATRMAVFAALSSALPLIITGYVAFAALRFGLERIALEQLKDALDGGLALIREQWEVFSMGEQSQAEAFSMIRRHLSGPPKEIHISAPAAENSKPLFLALGLDPASGWVVREPGDRLSWEGGFVGRKLPDGSWIIEEPKAVREIAQAYLKLPIMKQYEISNGLWALGLRHDFSRAAIRIRGSGYVWALTGSPQGYSGVKFEAIHPSLLMTDISGLSNEEGVMVGLVISNMNGNIDSAEPGEYFRYRYLWRNPDEPVGRRKMALMTYYPPWNLVVSAGLYEDEVFGMLESASVYAVLLTLGSAFAFSVLAYFLANSLVAKRASLLAEELGRIEAGDYDLKLPEDWAGEFGAIARAAKRMAEGIREREESLRRSQKLEAAGSLAAGIAHDVNNTLAGILGSTSLLRLDLEEGKPVDSSLLKETLDSIDWATRRAALVTRRLLSFSRKGGGAFLRLDLAEVIDSSLRLCRKSFDPHVALRWERPNDRFPVLGEEGQLEQLIMNLVINARDAVTIMRGPSERQGGQITLRLAAGHPTESGARTWELLVEDDGAGMSQETLDRAFEPFFSTKKAESGTGLGLHVARDIALRHGGKLGLESELGRGTRARLSLPAVTGGPEGSRGAAGPIPHGSGRILLAEDDPAFRPLALRMLEELGYEAEAAADGVKAMELFSRDSASWTAMVMDVAMPGLSGPELSERVRHERPGLPILVISAYGEGEGAEAMLASGPSLFLRKPFDLGELARALAALREGSAQPHM